MTDSNKWFYFWLLIVSSFTMLSANVAVLKYNDSIFNNIFYSSIFMLWFWISGYSYNKYIESKNHEFKKEVE